MQECWGPCCRVEIALQEVASGRIAMGSGRAIARAARIVDEDMRTTMRTSNSEEAKDRVKHK